MRKRRKNTRTNSLEGGHSLFNVVLGQIQLSEGERNEDCIWHLSFEALEDRRRSQKKIRRKQKGKATSSSSKAFGNFFSFKVIAARIR